jgi:hypothetical protein
MTVATPLFSKPVLKGSVYSAAYLIVYLLVVVLTTPALPPVEAVRASLSFNGYFLALLLSSIWFHGFLRARAASRSCTLRRGLAAGAAGGGSFIASVLSFLSLTQVGCCSFWLYAISLLAGIGGLGTALAGIIVDFPFLLMALGVSIIWAGNIYILMRLSRSKTSREANRPFTN